jgi:hypothetical protein
MKRTGVYLGLWRAAAITIGSVLCGASSVVLVKAASWNSIEPFKSRRPDVLQILGQPINESSAGVLRFNVAGGTVLVSFVDQKFVTIKKLRPEVADTVLEIVLQHEHSSDTPESMHLLNNRDFSRDDVQNASIFRNTKEGIIYTFFDGKLRSTRYTFSEAQISHARR